MTDERNETERYEDIEELMMGKEKDSKEFINDFLGKELSPREAEVLRMRLGVKCSEGEEYTLDEVAKQFDVSRERIRQIEAKALRKLRQERRGNALRQRMIEEENKKIKESTDGEK